MKVRIVVTDGGGVLSHAAIICREYRIPCVVDAKAASLLLKTGDRVAIDLKTGQIEKIV